MFSNFKIFFVGAKGKRESEFISEVDCHYGKQNILTLKKNPEKHMCQTAQRYLSGSSSYRFHRQMDRPTSGIPFVLSSWAFWYK